MDARCGERALRKRLHIGDVRFVRWTANLAGQQSHQVKTLFPDMDREIDSDRKAARRETVQRARDYLRGRNLSWLVNQLIERGPATEHMLMVWGMDEEYAFESASKRAFEVIHDLYALWTVRKLWRRKAGIHPGSGEECYLYGIRGVHPTETK